MSETVRMRKYGSIRAFMPTRQSYPTDLTNARWRLIRDLVPAAKVGPNPTIHARREIVNALLYKARSGCSWRLLPNDFPPWKTVSDYFYQWRDDGTWERITDALREKVRTREGRAREPSLGIVDSQTVKSASGGEAIGYDGNKKTRGRKRHLVVDVLGLLLALVVTSAAVMDRDAVPELLHAARAKSARLEKVLVDSAYNGDVVRRASSETAIVVEMTKRSDIARGFVPEPKRWVVERTFGSLTHSRQLSKEYDRTTSSSEAWFRIVATSHMLGRLA